MVDINYAKLAIVNALPKAQWLPIEGAKELGHLIGAKVVAMGGTSDEVYIEGGGLLIDYVPVNDTRVWRLVLGFTELGMYVEYHGLALTNPDGAP